MLADNGGLKSLHHWVVYSKGKEIIHFGENMVNRLQKCAIQFLKWYIPGACDICLIYAICYIDEGLRSCGIPHNLYEQVYQLLAKPILRGLLYKSKEGPKYYANTVLFLLIQMKWTDRWPDNIHYLSLMEILKGVIDTFPNGLTFH